MQISSFLRRLYPDGLRPIHFCRQYIEKICARKIYSGPFEGLHVGSDFFTQTKHAKLLGIYEKELHTIIDSILQVNPTSCLVAGAADGYYAIGLAAKLPDAHIYAYESDEWLQQQLIRKSAKAGYENITYKGKLSQLDTPLPEWVIMDIEGDEVHIVTKELIQANPQTTWVIELHDQDYLSQIVTFLRSDQSCRFIPVAQREITDYPKKVILPLPNLLKRYWLAVINEWRSNAIGWIIIQKR